MDESTKELTAIGASIAAHSQSCLTFHVDKAREPGIGDDEINEAFAVGAHDPEGGHVVHEQVRRKRACRFGKQTFRML